MQALLICRFDTGKMLQGRLSVHPHQPHWATLNTHQYAVGAGRVALLLISSGRASMVMCQRGTIRKMTWTAGWSPKKGLEKKHNAKAYFMCITVSPRRTFQSMFQQLKRVWKCIHHRKWLRLKEHRNRTQEQRCTALDTWCSLETSSIV